MCVHQLLCYLHTFLSRMALIYQPLTAYDKCKGAEVQSK